MKLVSYNYDDNDNNYTNSDKGKDDNDDYSDIDHDWCRSDNGCNAYENDIVWDNFKW